jgi:hypothetical protein
VLVRTATGTTFEFSERPWTEIASFLGGMAEEHSEFQYLADIIESLGASGRDKQLAGSTSMHDLVVVPQPVGKQVYELLIVRAPSSMRPGPRGLVRIEHLSSTGHNECVDRPVSLAVPLFWRFIIEKFGIDPPARPA